jgi:hypothetical protein
VPPKVVLYSSEAEYRRHYETNYCSATIYTLDGMRVYFPKQQFDDAFFESADRRKRDKSVFSMERAKRIDWIKAALQETTAELYIGWDRNHKCHKRQRRVCVVYGNYVVVLNIRRKRAIATFITAYVADTPTLKKIRSGPRW